MPILIQRAMAAFSLVILSPLIAILAVAVRRSSPGPVIHRSVRVGREGEPFVVLKFRTMAVQSDGSALTSEGDPRVTPLGHWLRRTKMDELPQLWNVARGEMAIVGPRPEDPRYVDLANSLQREVLSVRPGMTGPTALLFADEEHRLASEATTIARSSGRSRPTVMDIDIAYRSVIQPEKLRIDGKYVRTRSPRGDLRIIARTFGLVLARATRS